MHRPPTRKQAHAWLSPIRKALQEILTGEVDTYRGHVITEIKWAGNEVARVDHAINGFVSMMARANPEHDLSALKNVSRKLEYGIMLTEGEVYKALGSLISCEDIIIKIPREKLLDWARTEQISIAMQGV